MSAGEKSTFYFYYCGTIPW